MRPREGVPLAVKERPILFNGPMVRQILADQDPKTQTRRVLKPRLIVPLARPIKHAAKHPGPYFDSYCSERKTPENPRGMSDQWCWWTADDRPDPLSTVRCPFGAPGDRLWVREAWCLANPEFYPLDDPSMVGRPRGPAWPDGSPRVAFYAATDEDVEGNDGGSPWKPSIHMPRWAARITLEVTAVRVERLHAIADADAWAEGIAGVDGQLDDAAIGRAARIMGASIEDARASFGALWATIHGEQSLVEDPFVWVVEFRRSPLGAGT